MDKPANSPKDIKGKSVSEKKKKEKNKKKTQPDTQTHQKENEKQMETPEPKKTEKKTSSPPLLIAIRVIFFTFTSCLIMVYNFYDAAWLRTERSYIRTIWPLEYQIFPNFDQIYFTLDKYDYSSHQEFVYMMIFGSFNVFFYAFSWMELIHLRLTNWSAKKQMYFLLLPLLTALVDLLENFLIFYLLVVAPLRSVVAHAVGYFILTKHIFTALSLFLIFVLWIDYPFRALYRLSMELFTGVDYYEKAAQGQKQKQE